MSNPAKDLLQSLANRIESPISGVFSLIWLITNWKVPVILIFGFKDTDRTSAIQLVLDQTSIWQIIVTPIILSAFYLFGMPWMREQYSKWLGKVEYRIAKHKLGVEADLQEVRDYRSTLKTIVGLLGNQFDETLKAFRQIEKSTKSENKNSILEICRTNINRINLLEKQLLFFQGTYTGELPDAYKFFFENWVYPRKAEELIAKVRSTSLIRSNTEQD